MGIPLRRRQSSIERRKIDLQFDGLNFRGRPMTNDLFILTRCERACKIANRERPRLKSNWVNENSVCIKIDETVDVRYPMMYVFWTDSLTGETGYGWILSSRLRSIDLI